MKTFRTSIGVLLSVAWILWMLNHVYHSATPFSEMKLNELGDFFAGFCAPLAFFWLVIGYFQQGEELKSSTAALSLQAQELENSVAQQKDLVDVSRQQVEAARQALIEERQIKDRLSKPILSLTGGYRWAHSEHAVFRITVRNSGHDAAAFNVELPSNSEVSSEQFYVVFRRAESIDVTFSRPDIPSNFKIVFRFVDGLGREDQRVFSMRTIEPDKLEFDFVTVQTT
jgi:hypothetical protein